MAERTIAELWKEFQCQFESCEFQKRHFVNPGCTQIVEALRKELLERCKRIIEDDNNPIEFGIEYVHFPDVAEGLDCCTVIHVKSYTDLYATARKARDIGAAWLFMAWELEQRERENETKPTP